ncbi:MAG: hypothetical protein JXA52_07295, partial [Planctomycetes bacterium]|nr:hypothetical protein [Planctomycetota bacterium]
PLLINDQYLVMEVMWCPNSDLNRITDSTGAPFTIDSAKYGKYNFYDDTCYCTTIKCGSKMRKVINGVLAELPEISIDLRFGNNNRKAVFTEFFELHDEGINALFGDGHVRFFAGEADPSWDTGDSLLFRFILGNN